MSEKSEYGEQLHWAAGAFDAQKAKTATPRTTVRFRCHSITDFGDRKEAKFEVGNTIVDTLNGTVRLDVSKIHGELAFKPGRDYYLTFEEAFD